MIVKMGNEVHAAPHHDVARHLEVEAVVAVHEARILPVKFSACWRKQPEVDVSLKKVKSRPEILNM